jgi:hypothetical protein
MKTRLCILCAGPPLKYPHSIHYSGSVSGRFQPPNQEMAPPYMDWKALSWWLGYAVVACLSLDFWNWGVDMPLIWGLPSWVLYMAALTLLLSVVYALMPGEWWGERL